MKRKMMILGTGPAQVDAVVYCKKAGFEVHGCSYRSGDKAEPMLDVFVQLDIRDIEGIKAYMRENGIGYVYSIGSELAIPSVMQVSEELGLPHFVSGETAFLCRNKNLMRECLAGMEGNLPFATACRLEELEAFGAYPCMLKPVDSQGQRGCYRIEDEVGLHARFPESLGHSASGYVILEHFVDGPEVSANAYFLDGDLAFFLVSDRIVFDDLPGGVIKEHHLPSRFASAAAVTRIEALVREAAARLGIRNGPAYFQIKLKGDAPYLLEATPRLDGCHMWNLIRHYCGADLLDAAFTQLTQPGQPLPLQMKKYPEPKKLVFLCQPPDCVFDRENYKIGETEDLFWYYESGDTVRAVNGRMEKCGYYIC